MREAVRARGAGPESTALGAASVGGVQHADQPGQAQPDPSGRRARPNCLYQACMAAAHGLRPSVPSWSRTMPRANRGGCAVLPATKPCSPTGARLFRAQGYPAVSTSEIGKGAGIAGQGFTARSRPNRPFWTRSSAALDEWRSLECIRALRANSMKPQRLQATCRGSCSDQRGCSGPRRGLDHRTVARLQRGARRLHEKSGRPRGRVDRPHPKARPRDDRRRGAAARRGGDQLHRRRRSHMASHALRRRYRRDDRHRAVDPDQPVRIPDPRAVTTARR